MFISQTIFSELAIKVAKKQPWTSSTNLDTESFTSNRWLLKNPVVKENAEQRTGNVCEEEVEEDEEDEDGEEEDGEDEEEEDGEEQK